MLTIVYDNSAGAGGAAARMKEQVSASGGFVNLDMFVRIAIDIQNTAGISATNRNHALRNVEPEKQTLSPRHREMSGHPESRGNFSGGSLHL